MEELIKQLDQQHQDRLKQLRIYYAASAAPYRDARIPYSDLDTLKVLIDDAFYVMAETSLGQKVIRS